MSQPRPPPPGNILPGGAWERHAHQAHDSAHRHPVFFTERLMRPPPMFGGAPAPSVTMSPVAQGYVYQEGHFKTTPASKL
ncbi:hypothetical protein Daus18300_003576 [Diaporthe australafricana]|uniref:Uncharacterized protein n=1 Tax=Diaporthe australafricana TaxID=127596 RepID=A0ABR3XFU6_9PEZI